MLASCHFEDPVALSEKFLWQVLLTNQWNYLFQGSPCYWSVFPCQLSFCPRERVWHETNPQGKHEYKRVIYRQETTKSQVVVTMFQDHSMTARSWFPALISIDLLVLDMQLQEFCGERIIVNNLPVIPCT